MANICRFNMVVKGEKDKVEIFKNMIRGAGTVHMGSCAEIDNEQMEKLDNNIFRCFLDGQTEWSVLSSLISDAITMREEPETWNFCDTDKPKFFITLFEACEQLELDMECYSDESDIGFQEHFLFVNGELLENECIDYDVDDYDDYDDDDYDDDDYDEDIFTGGFGEWKFQI